eukprot:g39673.t1
MANGDIVGNGHDFSTSPDNKTSSLSNKAGSTYGDLSKETKNFQLDTLNGGHRGPSPRNIRQLFQQC